MSAAQIRGVLRYASQRVTHEDEAAYRADLALRCGVEIGQMIEEDVLAWARARSATSRWRKLARLELRRREALS